MKVMVAHIVLFVMLSSLARGQILNGGFEEWTDGKPDYWEALGIFSAQETPGFIGNSACSVHTSTLHGLSTPAIASKIPFKINNNVIGLSFWYNGWGYAPFSLVYSIKSVDTVISKTEILPNETSWNKVVIQFPTRHLSDRDSLYLRFDNNSGYGPIGFSIDEIQFDTATSGVNEIVVNEACIQPNPISSRGSINLCVDEATKIQVGIYDLLGREIMLSGSFNVAAGKVEIPLNVINMLNGAYYLKCNIGKNSITRKLLIAH